MKLVMKRLLPRIAFCTIVATPKREDEGTAMTLRRFVADYRGEPLSKADLPPADTARWTASKKANVVIAIRSGLLSLEEAERKYMLSTEELMSWKSAYDARGIEGLKATKLRN